MLDTIFFGNKDSEISHDFAGKMTKLSEPVNGESCRIALPMEPPCRFAGEYGFTLKVDPYEQNFLSVKMYSTDGCTPLFLLIAGKQLGYFKPGSYEALNTGYGSFYPAAFYFTTTAIPVQFTHGKTKLRITLRQGQAYSPITDVQGRIFSACTHLGAYLPPADKPEKGPKALPHKKYTPDEIDSICGKYIENQQAAFNASLNILRSGEKISITKYVESFRQFCMMLYEPYCPAAADEEKDEAVGLILNCIDLYVRDYYADVRTLARTSHQSDWGGYYGELGQGLYILEPLIKNDRIFGKEKFLTFLDEPFNCNTEEGEFSLCGNGISRKAAWERCLKANFDFASARQSYIYNQTYYTYEGAWNSMAGLGVIESPLYIGDGKCRRILLEALGLAQWRGEHRLTDAEGRELDLYHCLFNHDKNAVFTDDFIQVVCKGLAVQMTDEHGEFARRRPYGDNYFPLSMEAMTRENGYVGNYGETANYIPEWVYRTWNHGDRDLSDEIMRAALKNIHSRSLMRYHSIDSDGNRIIHMEQGVDERNPAMPGKTAYGPDIYDGRRFLFASLKRHMEENGERYVGAQWDIYKTYADEALSFTRQQRLDGRLDFIIDDLAANYNDFRIDRTVRDIMAGEVEYVLPHTDFSLYSPGELKVPSKDYLEFAWVDIDNLTVSLRDGDTSIFAALNVRNRGYCGTGRAHVRCGGAVQLMQLITDGIFEYGGKYICPQNVNMDFIADDPEALAEFAATPQALCGEEIPITYQRGIGKVLRENLEVDTPYSGYPDVIWTRIGRYFVIVNTTRESYENAKAFTAPVPECGKLYDMRSKTYIDAEGGKITLAPLSAVVLRLSSETDGAMPPSRVNILECLPNSRGNLLWWKQTAGGKKYNLYRNGKPFIQTSENHYLDADVQKGESYIYAVAAENEQGEGSLSYEARVVAAKDSGQLIPLTIGSAGGEIKINVDSAAVYCQGAFGEGDDYRALERDIRDRLCLAVKTVMGGVGVSAKVSGEGGVILREDGEENSRYAYVGFEGEKIICRFRSRNTMYKADGKLSPLKYEFTKAAEDRYLRLVRDIDSHTVSADASADGKDWRLLITQSLPLPAIIYAGAAATGDAEFSEMKA